MLNLSWPATWCKGARPLKRCFIFSFSQGISVKDEYYVLSCLSRVNCELSSSTWLLKDRLSLKGGFSRFQQQPFFEGIFKIFHSLPPFLDIQEQQNLQIFCRILFIRQKATYKQNFVARKKPSKFISQQAKKVNGRFYIAKGVALQFLLQNKI